MSDQRFWEIILEFGYVYADDEDAAWSEANRLLNDNGSVDFTLREKTSAECDAERAAVEALAVCEAVVARGHYDTCGFALTGERGACSCPHADAEAAIAKARGVRRV